MTHHTRPTRSFILLIVLTLAATYAALTLAKSQKNNLPSYSVEQPKAMSASADQDQKPRQLMPTTGWQVYRDSAHALEFMYPAGWTATADSSVPNFFTVKLTRKDAEGAVKVYVSEQGFFALNGLPTKTYSVGGRQGLSLGEWVYAVKVGDLYYTFDSTETTRPAEELPTIVNSAKFE